MGSADQNILGTLGAFHLSPTTTAIIKRNAFWVAAVMTGRCERQAERAPYAILHCSGCF